MPSSFTQNINLEKPATGEQPGTWGVTVNNNYDVLDATIEGNVGVPMPDPADNDVNHPSILSSSGGGGAIPYGAHKVIIYTGNLGATGYVQIEPGTAQRFYMVSNKIGDSLGAGNKWSLIFQQGDSNPGQTFTLQNGYSSIIYSDGGGATGNVFGAIDSPQFTNVLVTGDLQVNGSITQGGGATVNIVIDQAHGIGIGTTNSPPAHAIDIGDALGGEIWIDTADPTTHWRQMVWTTAHKPRWSLRTTVSPAETGSNAGSDLYFLNFDDSGNQLQSVIYLNRASGDVTIGTPSSGGMDQGARLAVCGANPGVTTLGVQAAAAQSAPVFLCQNSAKQTLVLVDPAGQVRANSFYAPSYTTGSSPGQYTGISYNFTLPNGVTLYFQNGLLVQHTP
jgi:hypothetical protein